MVISNRKGLSNIVSTLLIMLLVIVAIGIIWAVISNTLESGTKEFSLGSKCLAVEIKATAVNCAAETSCSVTLTRSSGGEDIAGVKLIFYNNDSTETDVVDWSIDIPQLETKTNASVRVSIDSDISKMEVVPYFADASGNEQLCSGGTTFNDVSN